MCSPGEIHPLEWKQNLFENTESQNQYRERIKKCTDHKVGTRTVCLQSLEPDPDQRLQEMSLLTKSLQQWLNGAMKQQQALEYLAKAHGFYAEQNELRRHISVLVASYPETLSTHSYQQYQDIVAQRVRMKEYVRLQEQEPHKGILQAPGIVALHSSLIELDFQRYERSLQHGKHEIAEDIHLKLNTHLSVLPTKERDRWNGRIERCRKVISLHPFNTPFIGHDSLKDTIAEILHSSNIVTVCGSPGIGKSRIAIEIARTQFIRNSRPFHVISCSEITTLDQVFVQIAHALQVEINSPSLE